MKVSTWIGNTWECKQLFSFKNYETFQDKERLFIKSIYTNDELTIGWLCAVFNNDRGSYWGEKTIEKVFSKNFFSYFYLNLPFSLLYVEMKNRLNFGWLNLFRRCKRLCLPLNCHHTSNKCWLSNRDRCMVGQNRFVNKLQFIRIFAKLQRIYVWFWR